MNENTIFGIDLGTTYSCISYIDEHGQPVVVQNNEGDLTTPSVVFFEDMENVVVGKAAKDAIRTDADRVVSKVKREMGNSDWRFDLDGKEYRPEEVSALILKKIVDDATLTTGKTISEVVITCPAYFGSRQKEATKKAGEIAGLNVRYVIPEPTAAAIAYGEEQENDDTVLVYDLGGGTFDITLVDVKKGALTVLSTDGDAELGGFNWDTELAQFLAQKVAEETGESVDDILGDGEFYADLLLMAEEAKRTLSTRETAKQVLLYGGERIKTEVTRDEFNDLTRHLLDRTIEITKTVFERAESNTSLPVPKRILLVGGSTYMPQVKQRIEQEFPGLDIRQQDPNQIVAKGAAIFGLKMVLEDKAIEIFNEGSSESPTSTLVEMDEDAKNEALAEAGKIIGLAPTAAVDLGSKLITNVTSRSFGLRAYNELNQVIVSNMIHVDDQLPRTVQREFYTMEEGQSSVEIALLENEIRTSENDTDVDETSCIALEQAILDLGGPFPKGSPIGVTFKLSPDGILQVIAEHLDTGRSIPIERKVEGLMSDDEVSEAKSKMTGLAVS
ncbi:Hsp70 family protein [Gimesia maris]|uniref:Chaperone protein DnaK n=1 Tax=Gimesia maris TaxID=122 RepID=A0ABX5YRU8_9PLAN|nr:Hsp70 family protein [Gimesia maris]EDL59220.1 DnaK protein (heat shock protein), HSP70/DnaK family [Gimesia maris DSM 8797]QEG18237.1 Chaperone protein DnaK [Gimesia maris]QGQ28765.1 Hsp70 family protein [Gimesia maris]